MIRLFNFNMPTAKKFNYRPMYYDERKERLEKMKARAIANIAAEKDSTRYIGLESGFLENKRAESKLRHPELQKASMWRIVRLLVILIALLGISYYIAPDLFLAFWKIR